VAGGRAATRRPSSSANHARRAYCPPLQDTGTTRRNGGSVSHSSVAGQGLAEDKLMSRAIKIESHLWMEDTI